MKIKIDREKCIGCGTCVALCPDVYELDNNFKAQIKADADLAKPCVKDAAGACPVGAITIEND